MTDVTMSFVALVAMAFSYMEPALKVLAFLVMIPVILFMMKALVLWPIVIAKVSADGVTGALNQIRAALHYFANVEKLKTIYIREGKFTYKPLNLVRSDEDKPSDINKQS